MNPDFDADEQKAIDKIDIGETKTVSFKEYQMHKIEE